MKELFAGQLQQISIDSILDSFSDGILIVNKELLITSFNRAAEKLTGIPRWGAIGQRCSKVLRSTLCKKNCIMQKTFATKTPILNRQAFLICAQGHNVPVNISTTLLRNRFNEMIGGVAIIQEIHPLSLDKSPDQVTYHEMMTRNQALGRIIKTLPKIAASRNNVLIEGECGTGKEVVARAIHGLSRWRRKPFFSLSCAALSEIPFPLNLFGNNHFFTMVFDDNPACITLTRGSTLFLSEISEAGMAIQGQLASILPDKTTAVSEGANKLSFADVRVIASTSKNMHPLMATGSFSRELYCRINGVSLVLPPLRERKEDIPLLIDHFISSANRLQNKSVAGVSQEALDLLMVYNFPGNICELKNIIAHAYASCAEGYISPSHLPPELMQIDPIKQNSSYMERAVQAVEAQAIIAALERNKYNRSAAAHDLGIHKSTFFRKIKQLGIVLPQIDGRYSFL